MGINNSKAENLRYEPKDWHQTDTLVFHQVMRNKDGQLANLYHFNIKSDRNLKDEVQIYTKRKSPANWVQVIGANLTSSGFGFCGTQENACILTETIPVLLNSVPRLNRQQSAIVLYNALRGYSDVSRIVVPGVITDRMIGFNRAGQTKVWVNENFGMNHPSNQSLDAHLDEVALLNNLVNVVTPRLDLTPDFLNVVRNSRTLSNALSFIRANSGVPENLLQANRVNIAGLNQQNSSILSSNVQFQPAQQLSTPTFVRPQNTLMSTSPVIHGTPVNFVHQPSVNYRIPLNSQPQGYSTFQQPPVQNKFSFTTQ